MISRVYEQEPLTVGDLLDLLHHYVEHEGLPLDAQVRFLLCDPDNDTGTAYPVGMLGPYADKSALLLFAPTWTGKEYEDDYADN